MTPQERQMVDDLFDRLARLETAPRDADAERAIMDGLRRAPNAVYALVQTALVQDEALKRADARIRELSGESPDHESPGFLDSMREAFTGRSRTSVPSVRANANQADPRWNTGGAYQNAGPGQAQGAPYAAAPAQGGGFGGFGGGGSFLGTAAASAAGMIGGSLLLNSISSMFGHRGGGSAFASTPSGSESPWDNRSANSDLARDAGLNDVGGGRGGNDPQAASLFGNDDNDNDDLAGDPGGDFDGGGDFGGGDTA